MHITRPKHDWKLEQPSLIHLSMDYPETWHIESHILCLDATQVWETDIQFRCFYFAGGDPGIQEGCGIVGVYWGLVFFMLTCRLGLTKYVSGRLSIYGKATSIYGQSNKSKGVFEHLNACMAKVL